MSSTPLFIPAGTRFFTQSVNKRPSRTSLATSTSVFAAFFQHILRIRFEEWQNETSDETTQNAPETVAALKSSNDIHGYFASVLARVIFFVEIAIGIATVLSVLHVDASNNN